MSPRQARRERREAERKARKAEIKRMKAVSHMAAEPPKQNPDREGGDWLRFAIESIETRNQSCQRPAQHRPALNSW